MTRPELDTIKASPADATSSFPALPVEVVCPPLLEPVTYAVRLLPARRTQA